jgi:hypothetical protein
VRFEDANLLRGLCSSESLGKLNARVTLCPLDVAQRRSWLSLRLEARRSLTPRRDLSSPGSVVSRHKFPFSEVPPNPPADLGLNHLTFERISQKFCGGANVESFHHSILVKGYSAGLYIDLTGHLLHRHALDEQL